MRKIIRCGLVFTLGIGTWACNLENKKPDAVVISNEEKENNAAVTEAPAPGTDTTDLTTTDQDTGFENYTVAEAGKSGTENKSGNAPATAAARNSMVATPGPAETDAEKNDSRPAEARTTPKVPVKPVVRTRLSVQQQLARDARLASQMPLAKFGRYMERRADYYRSFGEVSYDDNTVEIKITREELKIQTPEGKYKRESDERKIKTDKGKIKEETRR